MNQVYLMDARTELLDSFFAYWQKESTNFIQVSDVKQFTNPVDTLSGILA